MSQVEKRRPRDDQGTSTRARATFLRSAPGLALAAVVVVAVVVALLYFFRERVLTVSRAYPGPPLSSNFDSTIEGWRSRGSGGVEPVHEAPANCLKGMGRCLRLDDESGEHPFYSFRAPSAWTEGELGDWERFYGGELTFWLKVKPQPNLDYAPSKQEPAVVIRGKQGNLELRIPVDAWPSQQWTRYVIPLREGEFNVQGATTSWRMGDYEANRADFDAVLPVVTDLYIRGEYYTGRGSDSAWLDEVTIRGVQ